MFSPLGTITLIPVHVARGQATREYVDRPRCVDRSGREDIHQQQLTFRDRMHGDVAIVVQQRRGEPARRSFAHRRHPGGVHTGGTRGGHHQAADEGTIGQLSRRHAEEIGDDVLVIARQASGHRPSGCAVRSRTATKAKLDLVPNRGKRRAGKRTGRCLALCAMHYLRSRIELLPILILLFALSSRSDAQQPPARSYFPPLELRIDAIDVSSAGSGTLQGGVGANVPLGYYVRLELVGAGGITKRDSLNHNSARIDGLARFLLDPFNDAPWGLSIGGGLSAMFEQGATTREYLVVVIDLEAPHVSGVTPALQLGLGGGFRAGVVLRLYRRGQR